jgi:hypothetical protein
MWLTLAVLLALSAAGCERASLGRSAGPALPPAQGGPVVLAIYQPWFGEKDHIDIGYSSLDRNVQQRQVQHAKDLGIEGFVVDWYGPHKTFMDRGYALMQQVASENAFHVALLYDESSDGDAATDSTISDLQYAYDHYIGPKAGPARDSYLTYNDRPVIFVFPKSNKTDWARVRQALKDWEQPPLIINEYRNSPKDAQFDGLYVWVHPGQRGWAPDGSHWGGDYLDSFYHTMVSQYPDQIAVGGAWAKFDDSRASWSQNRHISDRCGKTFEETLRAFRRYYNERNPLPFLLIETWNDYEEGTAIEPGVPSCHDKAKMDVGQ